MRDKSFRPCRTVEEVREKYKTLLAVKSTDYTCDLKVLLDEIERLDKDWSRQKDQIFFLVNKIRDLDEDLANVDA